MHRQFRQLLNQAKGASDSVIAIFLDIRGFSAFSQSAESTETAMYMKRVYARLIDDYFSDAAFFKPTGDGLMVVIPFEEDSLKVVSAKAVRATLKALQDFPGICDSDDTINFPVPDKLGIGIARGSTCKIVAGNRVLDYSGRVLNLAARLMNLARPRGIVVDGNFKLSMIPKPEQLRFAKREVYLRGIAETVPRDVFVLDTVTEVPKENLAPFGEPVWQSVPLKSSLKQFHSLGPKYAMTLPSPPEDPSRIEVALDHPAYKNKKRVRHLRTTYPLEKELHFFHFERTGKHYVMLLTEPIAAYLEALGVTPAAMINVTTTYQPKR